MQAMYCKKIQMSRIFDEAGKQIPVTLVEAKNNLIYSVKQNKDHKLIKIAAGNKKRLAKPQKQIFEKFNFRPEKIIDVKTNKDVKAGDNVTLNDFKEGQTINITGISKGKGFAGTVKRHNFHTGPKTHGSNNYRQPGSIGDTGPQRVVKGRKMAGHMGHKRTTLKNVKIVKIIPEKSLILIKGAVPGPNNSWNLIWSQDEN